MKSQLCWLFRARKGPKVQLVVMVSKALLVCLALLDLRVHLEKTVTRSEDYSMQMLFFFIMSVNTLVICSQT